MPDIAYTLGEPAGIGPDIIIQLAQSEVLDDLVCIGDASVLERRAAVMGIALNVIDENDTVTSLGQLRVRHQALPQPDVCGEPSTENAKSILDTLDTATEGCLNGTFRAMTTGPLHKAVINDAGIAFSGHTEYLAEKTGAPMPVMLLATRQMRVALVTTHLPLKDVSRAITRDRIQSVCRIIDQDFRQKYGIESARILVCGLNPHAGEGGHLGHEEIDTIIPSLDELRGEGLDVVGPLPADTLFTQKVLATGDVALAMYHDQGLPVLKHQGFGNAANITLGLPIIRTSVDHGTALDIAGTGKADIGSLKTALAVVDTLN